MESLLSNPSKNLNLISRQQPHTHTLSYNDDGQPKLFDWAHKNLGYVAQELGFTNNPMLAAAPKYEAGVQKFITWFRDFARNHPTQYADIIEMYRIELAGPDRLIRRFRQVRVPLGVMSVEYTNFSIEHGPSELSVRNTPARIISAVEEGGAVHLSYYAQLKRFDLYALGLVEGVEDYQNGMIQVLSNLNASQKFHILKATFENTPCFYFTPEYINAGMRMPRTMHDCLENIEQHFNCFGKPTLTPEVILALAGTVMARQDRIIDSIVVPISKYDAFVRKGRIDRYCYEMSGDMARANQEKLTGALPADGSIADTIAGTEVITVPLLESNTINNTSTRILTAEVCSGGHAVFLKDFDALEPAKYISSMERIGVCSWQSGKYDWYKYHEAMMRDMRWHATPMVGGVPDFSDGVSGRLNRTLLYNFLGANSNSQDQRQLMEHHFAYINTRDPSREPSGDEDEDVVDHRCAKIDDTLIYHPERKIWYPWGVIGEASGDLSKDIYFELSYETLALRLREGSDTVGDAQFNNNAKRCLGTNHLAFSMDYMKDLADIGSGVPTYVSGELDKYDEEKLQARIKKDKDNHTLLHIATYPLEENPDFMRRWEATKEIFDPYVRTAARLFLTAEPSQETFFLLDQNNIANRFSGVIADFSELSDASTPVILAPGILGEAYTHPLAKRTVLAGEIKEGASEMGSFVGARIIDDRNFLPLLFGVGGRVIAGSSPGFMADLLPLTDRNGDPVERISDNHGNDFFNRWRRDNLNNPRNCPENSKLALFQGMNAGSANAGRGDFPREISLLAFWRMGEVQPYMRESSDFDQRDEQMFPGAAFLAWLLQPRTFFANHTIDSGMPVQKYSYANIVECRRSNTIAPRMDTVRYVSHSGKYELATGNHIRGPRTPEMVYTDQCQY